MPPTAAFRTGGACAAPDREGRGCGSYQEHPGATIGAGASPEDVRLFPTLVIEVMKFFRAGIFGLIADRLKALGPILGHAVHGGVRQYGQQWTSDGRGVGRGTASSGAGRGASTRAGAPAVGAGGDAAVLIALVDAQTHPDGVIIGDLRSTGFVGTKPRGVDGHQHCATPEVRRSRRPAAERGSVQSELRVTVGSHRPLRNAKSGP